MLSTVHKDYGHLIEFSAGAKLKLKTNIGFNSWIVKYQKHASPKETVANNCIHTYIAV